MGKQQESQIRRESGEQQIAADSGPSTIGQKTRHFSQVRNLPVVCIENGEEMGVVNGFLVDAEKGVLAAFVLGSREVGRGVRVLPLIAVSSFGSFALTIAAADHIQDLVSNAHYLALFEKDISLMGSKVLNSDEKLLGHIRDVSFDSADGTLLLLRISSDAAFLAPFQAAIPYSAVRAMRRDAAVVADDTEIAFRKDAGREDRVFEQQMYVPLVLKEEELKSAFLARLADEMERLRREVRESLMDQHEEYFITREKAVLERVLEESMRKQVEESVGIRFSAAVDKLFARVNEMVEDFLPRSKFQRALADFDARLKEHADAVRAAHQNAEETAKKSFDALSTELNQSFAALRDSVQSLLPEPGQGIVTEDALQIALSRAQADFDARLNALRDNLIVRTDEQLYSRASMREMEDLRNELRDAGETLAKSLRAELQNVIAAQIAPHLEKLVSADALQGAIAAALADVPSRAEAEQTIADAVDRQASDIRGIFSAELQKLQDETVQRFAQLPDPAALDSQILERATEALETVKKAILSDLDTRLAAIAKHVPTQQSIAAALEKGAGTVAERIRHEVEERLSGIPDAASLMGMVTNRTSEEVAAQKEELQKTLQAAFDKPLSQLRERLAALHAAQKQLEATGVPGDIEEIVTDIVRREFAAIRDILAQEVRQLRDEIGQAAARPVILGPADDKIRQWKSDALDSLKAMLKSELDTRLASLQAAAPHAEGAPGIEQRFDTLREQMQAHLEKRLAAFDNIQDKLRSDVFETLREGGLQRILFSTEAVMREPDAADAIPSQLTEDEAVTFFGQKITRSILGKEVGRDVLTDDHRLIIKKGAPIDAQTIELARRHGKFLELTMNAVAR